MSAITIPLPAVRGRAEMTAGPAEVSLTVYSWPALAGRPTRADLLMRASEAGGVVLHLCDMTAGTVGMTRIEPRQLGAAARVLAYRKPHMQVNLGTWGEYLATVPGGVSVSLKSAGFGHVTTTIPPEACDVMAEWVQQQRT